MCGFVHSSFRNAGTLLFLPGYTFCCHCAQDKESSCTVTSAIAWAAVVTMYLKSNCAHKAKDKMLCCAIDLHQQAVCCQPWPVCVCHAFLYSNIPVPGLYAQTSSDYGVCCTNPLNVSSFWDFHQRFMFDILGVCLVELHLTPCSNSARKCWNLAVCTAVCWNLAVMWHCSTCSLWRHWLGQNCKLCTVTQAEFLTPLCGTASEFTRAHKDKSATFI